MRIEDFNPVAPVNYIGDTARDRYQGLGNPEPSTPYFDYIQKSKDAMVNAPYYKPQNIYGTGGPDPVAVAAWAAPSGVSYAADESDRDPQDPGTGVGTNTPVVPPGDPEEPPEERGFDWMGMIMMMMLLGGGIGGGGMLGGLFGGKDDQQAGSTTDGGVTINIGTDDDGGEDWI